MLTIMILSYSFFSGTDNDRYVSLTFQNADAPTLIHGLAGYFDTQLYRKITLSEDKLTNFFYTFLIVGILPQTHTKGMISWFPIFSLLRYVIVYRILHSHFLFMCI